jgi:hypothetical protein
MDWKVIIFNILLISSVLSISVSCRIIYFKNSRKKASIGVYNTINEEPNLSPVVERVRIGQTRFKLETVKFTE